jgi:hypothetical protein
MTASGSNRAGHAEAGDQGDGPGGRLQRRSFLGLLAAATPTLASATAATPDKPQLARHVARAATSYLSGVAAGMKAGQWAPLTQPAGLSLELFRAGNGNTLGYVDKGCHDPVHRQVRFIGQAHYGDLRFHQYDEAEHSFVNLPDPPWDDGGSKRSSMGGHGYQHNALDPATGDLFFRHFNGNIIRWLHRATGEWTAMTAPNTRNTGGLEWLPNIGSSGGLVLYLGTSCHRWDKATDTWATPENKTLTGQTYHTIAVRSVPSNLVVFGGGNAGRRLWKIGASGGATRIADCPVAVGIGASVSTTCPISGDVLVFSPDNTLSRYEMAGNRWRKEALPTSVNFGAVNKSVRRIVAISMPAHGVVMMLLGAVPSLWLYKHA